MRIFSVAARAFAREYPEHAAPAVSAAGLIALAQIPRCAHYPTDVAAGMAIGWVAEAAVASLFPASTVQEVDSSDQAVAAIDETQSATIS